MVQSDVAEKMERLLAFLSALDGEPKLAGRLALHGGTAINAFLLDLPRMSVDVDLSWRGEAKPEHIKELQKSALADVRTVAERMGYVCSFGKGEHAGRTLHMRYSGGEIKADVNFMNRITPFPTVRRASTFDPRMSFTTLSTNDLIGGKVRAVLGRAKARDLYDIRSVARIADTIDDGWLHQSMLLYATLSDGFPHAFANSFADDLEPRFADLHSDIEENLAPVLKPGDPVPAAEELLAAVDTFLRTRIDPQNANEKEFVRLMREEAAFRPSLILPPDAAKCACEFPEALWKVRNLQRYIML